MITNLIVGKVRHGKVWHLYEENGDKLSLCGRTPKTEHYDHHDTSRITCESCKRLYDIIERTVQCYVRSTTTPHSVTKGLPAKRTGTRK